jgi:hypothetical protein
MCRNAESIVFVASFLFLPFDPWEILYIYYISYCFLSQLPIGTDIFLLAVISRIGIVISLYSLP